MKQFSLLLGASLLLVIIKIKSLIVDGDTFWAIKAGEWITINRDVPRSDSFSWTANGNSWVAHEWLFDLLIYKIHNAFGYYGIALFVSVGLLFILYFLWKLYAGENKNLVLTIIIYTIVVSMIQSGIVARPQVYGYGFFVYFFYVLYRRKNLLWTLPPVTVIWANMHGSVVLGIAMLILQLFYDTAYSYFEDKSLSISKDLFAATILVPLASLINPYGIELWKASVSQITNDLNRQIVEWNPPDFKEPVWLFVYLAIIILTLFISFSKKDVVDKKGFYLLAIYLLGTFYEAMTSVRYFSYLAICWGLYILTLLPNNLFIDKSWFKKITVVYTLLIVLILFNMDKPPVSTEEAIDKSKWPIEAVNHIEDKRIFNDYAWGGYLIYKNIPVFIDGRADVYWKNYDVFEDYMNASRLKKDPIDIFNKYNVEQVIIHVDSPLDLYLKRAGGIERYRDETAVIYYLNE